MNFNLFTSKTFYGALVAAITAATQLDWSHGVPIVPLIGILGVFIAAIGVRDAIASNGAAATATSANVANGVTGAAK